MTGEAAAKGVRGRPLGNPGAVYRFLDGLLTPGFRLMPGMKVRAEIKVGKRSVISYFLYPVIRALDESLREP